MLVKVQMQEIQWYEFTDTVEITPTEYATYVKTGKLPFLTDFDVRGKFDQTGKLIDLGHIATEQRIIDIEKV